MSDSEDYIVFDMPKGNPVNKYMLIDVDTLAALRSAASEADALRAELETLRNDHVVLMNDRNVTQAENDALLSLALRTIHVKTGRAQNLKQTRYVRSATRCAQPSRSRRGSWSRRKHL